MATSHMRTMFNTSTFFVFVFTGLLLALPARAQTAGENAPDFGSDASQLFAEIPSVFGASKYEQKVTEAPSSVTIITDEEIRRYGHRTLADILSSARGFYTSNDRNFSYAGIRGFSRPGDFNTRVLILLDGFRLNDAVYNAGPIDREFPVDVDLIDRIEIARGPSASLYGTSAFFGVVNIITKTGRQVGGVQLAGSFGSYDAGDGRATFGHRFANGVDLLVSGTLSDSAGQDLFFSEFSDVNGGVATGGDYERAENFFAKATFGDFTIVGNYAERMKGIPTASYGTTFNQRGNFTLDGTVRVGVTYEHRFQEGVSLTARVGVDDLYEDGEYIYDWAEEGDPEDLVTYFDRIETQRVTSEVTLTKQLGNRHRVVAGTEYRNNFKLHQKGFDREAVYIDDDQNSTVWAAYAQDEFALAENLILNAGLRFDRYGFTMTTTNVSPRLALIYSPLKDTSLKMLYGEAFRAPSTYELYFLDDISQKRPTHLDPELMRSTEFVLEQQLGGSWQATASVYRYAIDDLISNTFDPVDELYVFANVETINAVGAEVEVEGRNASGWSGRMGYSVQRTREILGGQFGSPAHLNLTNSPRHMAKVSSIVPLLGEKLFAGVEEFFVSGRDTLASLQADSFLVTNLTLSSPAVFKGWDASLSVYNLFDRRYGDPGSTEHVQDVIQRDGRNFRLKLTYSFGS